MMFLDPRNPFLGVRIICSSEGFDYPSQYKMIGEGQYENFAKSFGICSSNIMKNRLPFMFNADLFNGFSFRKGCYLGQEIVSRSYFTGIVRRRVFPFYTPKNSEPLPEGTVLKDENKK